MFLVDNFLSDHIDKHCITTNKISEQSLEIGTQP